MKHNEKQFNLQFFADGAPAGDGGNGAAAPGESAPAQSQRSLEDLGVPKEKAERYRTRKNRSAPVFTSSAEEAEPPAEISANPPAAETKPAEQQAKLSLKDLLKQDEEYNREAQDMINKRLESHKKRHGDAEAKLAALAPMLDLFGSRYGIDTTDLNNLDYAALNKAVTDDESFYKDRAAQLGTDTATAKRYDQLERAESRRQRQNEITLEQQKTMAHFTRIQQESAELKKLFPTFDLEAEMQNPAFVRMTSPNIGISVEQAYRAIHAKEIAAAEAEAVARNVALSMSNSIQSGQRPQENGAAAKSSAPVGQKKYSEMTRTEREALKAQIYAAAARGGKLPLRG